MPALPSIVTTYLTSIKNRLKTGPSTSSNTTAAANNFLRAQDMASVLELLQEALSQSSNITATSGTATSVTKTSAFVANTQVGNYVVFNGNVTAALAGVSARVISNTVNTLTFASLPATPALNDTFKIVGGIFVESIAALRDGKGRAFAPAGNVYGLNRTVVAALNRCIEQLGGTAPTRNLGRPGLQTDSGSTTIKVKLNTAGIPFRIDQFKGAQITVTGYGTRKVVSNDESSVTLDKAFSSAPTAAVNVSIVVADSVHQSFGDSVIHPGGQPGENLFLAERIAQAQAAVVTFTLPT